MRTKDVGLLRRQAMSDPGLLKLSLWLLLFWVGVLTAMSGAIVLAMGSAGGPLVVVIAVLGCLVAYFTWRRVREAFDPSNSAAHAIDVHSAARLPSAVSEF